MQGDRQENRSVMGRKSGQTCHFAIWTSSELAAFLSPCFLCFLSLLLSDVLLLA